jgi:hypothetical protein
MVDITLLSSVPDRFHVNQMVEVTVELKVSILAMAL